MKIDSGIYKFTNIKNGKVYIGQTRYLATRYREHKSELLNSKHHNSYLQRAVNKYGFDSFEYEIICRCPIEELDTKEIYYITLYDATNRTKGYNINPGGNSHSLSLETKEKIRVSHYGQNSKLTVAQVEKIKIALSEGVKDKDLALKYGVDNTTINKIARCKNWVTVRKDLNPTLLGRFVEKNKAIQQAKNNKKRIKSDKRNLELQVRKMFFDGFSVKQIIAETGITYSQYKRITRSLSYLRDKLRYDKIIELKNEGLAHEEIGEILRINRCTVSNIIKKFSLQANTEVSQ